MIDGGKRAGDINLKERRKRKKAAAENRIKVLGEALGHVDDEDGVLIKVYDDIQEELKVKTDALKKSKQKESSATYSATRKPYKSNLIALSPMNCESQIYVNCCYPSFVHLKL